MHTMIDYNQCYQIMYIFKEKYAKTTKIALLGDRILTINNY